MNIIGKKNLYFLISVLVLVPGVVSLLINGLRLSIDFTGGSVFEFSSKELLDKSLIVEAFKSVSIPVESIVESSDKRIIVKSKPVDNSKNEELKKALLEKSKEISFDSFETVGPSIGKETAKNAFLALLVASAGILLYIAFSFRGIPKPYSSFRFGASAIIAVLHDAFVVLGIFSLLGKFLNVEINALFITAILTVIGFSVHDTIVVFDRIRENLKKIKGKSFEEIVNFSLIETLDRSLKTSITVIFTLFALLLLGGDSIRWFVFALLVGIISGTYSSIFNAAPILVVWEALVQKRKRTKK